MYTRQEISQVRKKFWTTFGQYMRPVTGADGEKKNWLNYKTGIRHIYFRMVAGKDYASVAIELQQTDSALQDHYFNQLLSMKNVLEQMTGEVWDWQSQITDENGNVISRISKTVEGVNIFNETDWPRIISFLKPRMIALDEFWGIAREIIN
ncbi:MAG: DUF4268 domain-containing protein [Chitinophagaceae bacterium]|nr:DUF4268 domain-containing protein [Chitinophagaceae bacterium]